VSSLVRLARPALAPYVLGLVVLGFAWAHWDRALTLRGGGALAIVSLAWLALHCGTLWLNAAVDLDEGPVLFGDPVRPPVWTALAGYAALAVSVPIAFGAGTVAGAACAGSAVLAVLYSHPRTFWKAHPLGGPLVNVIGYGLLSPLAGWSVVGVAVTPRTLVVWVLAGFAILGTYLAAQAFQEAEDRARGYRTLVATHGPRAALLGARVAIGVAMVGGVALAVAGWVPRFTALGCLGWWWVDAHLARWSRLPDGGTEREARTFTVRMLVTALLGIALAFVEYAADSFAHRPVAGLGTVAGHPPDLDRGR
jgi:4-hydroxybenzoate polyprenyltransferase